MVFASLEFLTLFLPLFLIGYALARPTYRNGVLLFSSWIFYGWWSPAFLLLFVGLTLVGWIGGLAIAAYDKTSLRGWMLSLFICINLLLLCWFKYANIVVESLGNSWFVSGTPSSEWQRVVLPIGLSFIVLQSVSYLIDVYRRTVTADRNLISFGAYQSMFVHLIAGPIIRYDWVKRELHHRPFDWVNFSLGARRFMVGMCMKVLIADTLAPVADAVFLLGQPSFADAWAGCIAYGFQLFFDFAGYSAMAIGLGMMLGFRFPENFNNPYIATSIQDFWRRWHLSLSSWLRDYLYIPLGGNRRGSIRTYINLLLTMSIAGLWHGGDSWNFLLWGIAHGIALCVGRVWSRVGMPDLPVLLTRTATLIFVFLAWTIFRAHTFDAALNMYSGQFGLQGYLPSETLAVLLRPAHWLALTLGIISILAPWIYSRIKDRLPERVLMTAGLWPVFGFLLAYSLIASRGAVPFLYFQF